MKKHYCVSYLVGASVLALSCPATAQDEDGNSTRQSATFPDEILVTATRRSENQMSVPIAVSALSASAIQSAGISRSTGLEQMVSSLVIGQQGVALQPVIRGVGTNNSAPGDEPNVAIYLDGIYQPIQQANVFDLLNIERIEVLKGPQGTLFGRNATGGAINIITRKPTDQPELQLSLGYGNFDALQAAARVSGPVANGLAADLAVNYRYDRGYVTDLIRGGKLGDRVGGSARGRLRWQPSTAAEVMLELHYSHFNDGAGYLLQPIDGNTAARRIAPGVVLPSRPREIASGLTPGSTQTQKGGAASIRLDLGGVMLESDASVERHEYSFYSDSDGTTANIGSQVAPRVYTRSWSEEVRLHSDGSGPLRWLVGAQVFDLVSGFDPFVANGTITFNGKQKTRAYAGFGEATYELADTFQVTAGIRYSDERKTLDQVISIAPPFVAQASFKSWTPRAALLFKPSNQMSVYASFSRGFKSGLFNSAATQRTAVKPETVDAYEVGVKFAPSSWLRGNVAAYWYEYDNLQVSARDAISGATTFQNAGAARIKGIDGEVHAAPLAGLSLQASAAYIHARYTKFPNALITVPILANGIPAGGNTQIPADISGNTLIRSPKFTASLGGRYEFQAINGIVTLGGNANYNSGYFLETGNRVRQPSYVLLNANLSWATPDRGLEIRLWGENLTSEDVALFPISSALGDFTSYRRPATYGVTLAIKR